MNSHDFLRKNRAPLFISCILITIAAGLAGVFSKSIIGRSWEKPTIDLRYRMSGAKRLSSEIVLLMEDSTAVAEFGALPSQRGLLAAFNEELHRAGAKVVAIDFRFEEPNLAKEDSLLIASAQNSDHFISGSYFPSTYEKNYADIDSSGIAPCTNCEIDEYRFFLSTLDSPRVLPGLHEAGADIAHFNIMTDPVNNQSTSIPGFIDLEALNPKILSTAFALEIIKKYYHVSNEEISVEDQHIVIKPAGEDHARIPILKSGEFFINHLGPARSFLPRILSWSEFNSFINSSADSLSQKRLSIDVRNKIVLIGGLLDENDSHITPFAPVFGLPGVYLHANAVDNILRGRFIAFASTPIKIALFVFIGAALTWIFSRPGPIAQISGTALMLAVYLAIVFVIFKYERYILPVTPVGLFVLLAGLFHGCREWIFSAREQERLKEIVELQEEQVPEEIRALGRALANQSSYFLVIFAIEERDYCFYSHWIDLQAVWRSYFQYLLSKEKPDFPPAAQLKKIGGQIKDQFGAKPGFEGLFTEYDDKLPLQIVTANLRTPWPLAYHEASESFLCEKYRIGISFASERRLEGKKESPAAAPVSSHRMAILFYGDWNGHAGKELLTVNDHVADLQRQFVRKNCSTLAIKERTQEFLHKLSWACEDRDNLRLIHYAGHARNGFLDVGEQDFLKPGTISETVGIRFLSRPLVFLNACSSGKLPEEWDKVDHLCTEFLACGAGACIATSFDVFEKTAGWFAGVFYEYFVDEGLQAGEALRRTINDLGRPDKVRGYDPDYDITRYFYQLFGDPTVTF